MFAGTMSAQKTTLVTQGNFWYETSGMMALGMSDNGRYICGSCTNGEGFVYDRETNRLVLTSDFPQSAQGDQGNNQFYAVSNEGIAYGWDKYGCVALGIDGTYDVFFPIPANWKDVAPYAVTADGSVVAGFVFADYYDIKPCYWENGEIHYLPFSTSEEAGFPINKGAKATAISSDGSVIMGNIENRSSLNPMVYWTRQEDGTYEYHPAFLGRYQDSRYPDGSQRTEYEVGPLARFEPMAMSRDGKTIALFVKETAGGKLSEFELALFDTETEELTIIPYDSNNLLYRDKFEFEVTGISSNGYITGYSGTPFTGPIPFIMKPGEYDHALTLSEAFPEDGLLADWEENLQGMGVYLTTGISADASYIGGYAEVMIEELGMYGYATFYIQTGFNGTEPDGPGSGIGSITESESTVPVYYNLQGQRVSNPEHGIFIKVADGKSVKVVR